MYANKQDALNDKNVLDTQATDDQGFVTFKQLPPYYGACIKESQTLDKYILRNKEKDIVSFYRDNGVRFLGEIEPKNMKVTSINQGGWERPSNSNKNVNQELQSLTSAGSNFNNNTNWLVFNDNGTEKLIAKKPLKHNIAWNSLYNAGVVFDQEGIDDLINADFTHSYYSSLPSLKDKDKGKGVPKTYKPTYVTVNNKKYIVRLMRAYNENAKINDNKSWGSWNSDTTKSYVKGSEWNRLLLPLIADGRYGSITKSFVESNMPVIANYSWWTDFGGNSDSSGKYDNGNDYGTWRWMQETGYDGSQLRAFRGYYPSSNGAASADGDYPHIDFDSRGWLAVLERVDK